MPVSDYPFISSTVSVNISDHTYSIDYELPKGIESFLRAAYNSLKIIFSLQAVIIIGVNLFLLVVIFSKSSLRRCLRNQLLISMAVANLMDSIFSIPLTVDFMTRNKWIHACHVAVVYSVLSHYTHSCIIVWGMVLLVVNYLCRLKSYGGPAFFLRMSSRTNKHVAPLLLWLLPWIIAIPLTFSIALNGVPDQFKEFWDNLFCFIILEWWAEITMTIFILVIPAVLMIVFVILTLIVYKQRTVIRGPADQNTTLEGPSVHVAAVVVCIIMSVAEGIHPYINVIRLPFAISFVIIATLYCISNMMSFVLPLLWLLLLKDLRAHASEILARISVRFCKNSTSDASASVTFSKLSEKV